MEKSKLNAPAHQLVTEVHPWSDREVLLLMIWRAFDPSTAPPKTSETGKAIFKPPDYSAKPKNKVNDPSSLDFVRVELTSWPLPLC